MELGIYKHYSRGYYEVIGVGRLEETLEEMVVYRALYGDNQLWIRPKRIFQELVEVNGQMVSRFSLIEEEAVVLDN